MFISIHAPTRERPAPGAVRMEIGKFQSTLPQGSDTMSDIDEWRDCIISIHAPARERHHQHHDGTADEQFQSTLPQGSDMQDQTTGFGAFIFQSTLPQGSDIAETPGLFYLCDFNPRSRKGATFGTRVQKSHASISIHAPARERRIFYSFFATGILFQSTLPQGSDLPFHNAGTVCGISIHAPARERLMKIKLLWSPNIFQSTLPQGSDCSKNGTGSPFPISIHAPARERRAFVILAPPTGLISIHAPARERPS